MIPQVGITEVNLPCSAYSDMLTYLYPWSW
nr:MAG TPA: hypothetical protein [Caudoviricetes sp.]